jgi:4-hydroxythreonine-4-phosphate dehydrogenase
VTRRPAERPRVAVTLGDPRGIGEEVVGRALAVAEVAELADWVIVGREGAPFPDAHGIAPWRPGGTEAEAGAVALAAVERGIALALAGEVDALVTAPVDKAALHAAGATHPGHTELLRERSGVPEVAMMMAAERTSHGGALRVVLATVHIPLREVPAALTTDLLVGQGRLTADALRRRWGIAEPRLAICALNPHASDGGLFGDEEARVLLPAAERLRAGGISASDPLPADTVFLRALRGEFDAVIAPYHDVGMAAFKTASFGSGVNVTLGLPFPRTSPDHGTALDIAGRGIADPASMIEALRLAVTLSGSFDTPRGSG